MRPVIARLFAAALCGFPLALHAQAQAYPNSAVRIVAPFPAGGRADGIPPLTGEMFKSMAGVRLTHIPYKGSAPALTDLLAGQVEMMFDNLGVSRQHVVSGKLKLLAVCSERRVASLPDVPALAEILPGFEAVAWFGIVAPPRTPMPIAEKISAAVAEVLKLPEVQKRLADLSADAIGNTPAQMAAFMKKDAERWRAVIRSAGVKAD